tara:strand:+ start:78 stop:1358 length:1281 start_codon:yes stop_codon:yes gene_type:complete
MSQVNIQKFENLFIISIISLLPVSIIFGRLIFQLNLILIIISFLYYLAKSNNKFEFFNDKNEIKIFIIILSYLVFNTFIAEDWTLSIRRNFFYFEFFLIVFSLRFFLNNQNILKKIIINWFLLISFVSFDVFFEYYFGFNILGFSNETGYTGRIASFFKDELIVGSFLLSFVVPIFSFLYVNNKFKLSIFFILISIIAIFLSGERASTIKVFIALVVITYCWNYKNYLKKYALMILLILVFTAFLNPVIKKSNFIQQNLIYKYITSTLNIISIDKEKSLKQNLINTRYLNQAVFSYEIFKNKILFGVGNKNYLNACHKYVETSKRVLCFTHAHQTYYELMAEHGLIGSFIIILSLIYLIFLNKTQNLDRDNKKKLNIFRIYLMLTLLPLIPTGSFFSSYISAIFWINYSFYTIYRNKIIIENFKQD